ncbi:MAG TPA: pyridoxamine 5'-phosphate oxidase family protein [Chloroflexota bacterium]|nr:pyridoxamine 5'-phosphate oxidase family protein [Chloroflexota bacterium]
MKQKNLDGYGHEALPWSRALEQLERTNTAGGPATTFWLSTVGPDGSPYCTGVGALWVDGQVYFTSGPGTRKSRNLAHNPQCAISVSLPGLDLTIRGGAERVTDQPTLERLAERYAAQGWPARAEKGGLTAPFSAPAAGPPPWHLYVIVPVSATGTASAEPQGATRWTF